MIDSPDVFELSVVVEDQNYYHSCTIACNISFESFLQKFKNSLDYHFEGSFPPSNTHHEVKCLYQDGLINNLAFNYYCMFNELYGEDLIMLIINLVALDFPALNYTIMDYHRVDL